MYMKLGTETGSVINSLMAPNVNSKNNTPVVDEGATVFMWTDRHAYTVREISKDGKKVKLQRCSPKRTDGNGMSDCQSYDYSEHTNNFLDIQLFRGNWTVPSTDVAWIKGMHERSQEEFSQEEYEDKFFNKHSYGLQVVDGYTRSKTKYNKISIGFGARREYHDFSF
jgi:hypothetical protein